MPKTRKPCPGCGWEPGVYSGRNCWREAGKVCPTCRRKLDRYEKMIDEAREAQTEQRLILAKLFYSWPAFSIPDPNGLKFDKTLSDKLYEVARSVSLPSSEEGWVNTYLPEHGLGGHVDHVYVPKEFPSAIRVLRGDIQRALNDAFWAGVQSGRRAIMQLARGDISLKDFEEEK